MWKSLITKEHPTHRFIEKKIDEIALTIKQEFQKENELGFINGLGGIISFMHYYNLHKDYLYFNKEIDLIFDKYSKILNTNKSFKYSNCDGLAGFVWSFYFFEDIKIIDEDSVAEIKEIKDNVISYLIENSNHGNFDYLYGCLILFSKYFHNENITLKLIKKIEELKEMTPLSSYSLAKVFMKAPSEEKEYDLGIAHGNSSVLLCLSQIFEIENNEHVKILIENLLEVYFKLLQIEHKGKSFFPYSISNCNVPINFDSRMAWCTGDLSIGFTLFLVSKRIGNNTLYKKSLDILLKLTKKIQYNETLIVDAGFCHGSSGVAHIFGRMFNYTEIEEFKNAAIFWAEITLKFGEKIDIGYVGYANKHSTSWEKSLNLITGISGIGLSLIALVDENEPKWDKCFLLS